jgi:hypothetical protein
MSSVLEHVGLELHRLSSSPDGQQHSALISSVAQAVTEVELRLDAIEAVVRASAKAAGVTLADVDKSLRPARDNVESKRGRRAVLQEAERLLEAGA